MKLKLLSIVVLLALLFGMFIYKPDKTAYGNTDFEDYTYKLTQSTADYRFWTTPPSERVFKNDAIPTDSASEVKVYAAQNEFEPFQVVVNPAVSGSVTVNVGDFGAGITSEIYQVKYVTIAQATDSLGATGDYPDPLWPVEQGASVAVAAGQNTAFWFSIHVPKATPAGDYTTNVQIGGVSIPIALHVFDFAIPDTLHVKSQMNFSHQAVLSKYSVSGTGDDYWMYVDKMKQFFIDHRLTSKSPLWPGGVTSGGGAPFIDYDCAMKTLSDPHGIWGFELLADKYLNGTGFNDGTGYPSFMAATFRNNDASQDQRPDEFCNESRSAADWYTANNPNTAYNQQWFSYMTALQEYLRTLGYLDAGYYYIANEPQNQEDYDAVAWYAQELERVAPDFKLMVSEEARSEIYNHPIYTGAKIDIWLPVLNNYNPDIAHDREKHFGEETWIYFLHGTRPPFFNPITLDHPGIESKFTGWFLWKYRVRGIAYYSLNNWGKNPWTDPMTDGHNGDTFMLYPPSESNEAIAYGSNNHRFVPSIRFELMRDSLEDYEYLYVLNGGEQPQVDQVNVADAHADKIISGLTSYTRDGEFMYNLRRLIGLKNGDEIATIPDVEAPKKHPRAEGLPSNYYINFQDPSGSPTADPLVVDGNTYMKIGWNAYDQQLGYGWFGDLAHVKYQYLDDAPNELQKSVLYDDWGRQKVFEFDVPNGIYNVTLSVGWQGKTYAHNKVDVEGVVFVDDEATAPYIVRTREVQVADNKLTMEMGIFDEYTMLNYMDVEAVSVPATPTPTAVPATFTPTAVPATPTFTPTTAPAMPTSTPTAVPATPTQTAVPATPTPTPIPVSIDGVAISGPISGEVGAEYTFTAFVQPASASAPIAYTWHPEPIAGQGSASATFRWNDTGEQTVSVVASNSLGYQSNIYTIAIDSPITLVGQETGIINTEYTFTALFTPADAATSVEYTWETSEHPPISYPGNAQSQFACTWNTPGTKTITVTAKAGDETVTRAYTTRVSAVPAPIRPTAVEVQGVMSGVVDVSYPFTATISPAAAAESFMFYESPYGSDPVVYTWETSGQEPVTHARQQTDVVSFMWDTPGTKVIYVTASNSEGSVTTQHIVTIREATSTPTMLAPDAVTISGPATGTIDSTDAFTATVSPPDVTMPITYTWMPEPNAGYQGLAMVQYTWPAEGAYTIAVTVTNSVGAASDEHMVRVVRLAAEDMRVYLPLIRR